jgi:L-rhamnose mutarotase
MKAMKRYCLTLDLKDDPKLIEEYEAYHKAVWPEVIKSIRNAGINEMEIYRYANRLFMIMDVDERFSFEEKTAADSNNPVVQRWEQLMWDYQQSLPGSKPGEKWKLMENIFTLSKSSH